MRGVSAKFMVLEQQSGPSGQIGGVLNGNPDYLHPTPKPGQMRLWCWNSIANGADGLLFFRWRSLPYGSEAHWNGLLYHDERNTWRLEEAKRLSEEIKRLGATLTSTRCVSQAAILYDFDNESHARIERMTGKYRESNELAVYQALSERHLSVDVRALSTVQTGADLAGYQIVFFPHAHILTVADVKPLREYVEAGGTLVFGCWSGYRSRFHWCYNAEDKAFYESLAGVRVADFTVVTPGETTTLRFEHSGTAVPAPIFNEILAPTGENAITLASYVSDYYAGQPGVTLHQKGAGRIVHFGTFFTPENASTLLDALEIQDPLSAQAEISPAIQATLRSNGEEQFCFLLNFTKKQQAITFREPAFDLLEGQKLNGRIDIPPYGVWLVRW
jgi:beta-galactosidase